MTDKVWKHPSFRLTALQMLALGFALMILLGALLLMLPIASRDHRSLPFLSALFTSASATCVTGLVVCDTYTQFTFFGQAILLLLIQIGGLGFMTVAVLWAMILGRRIGLLERSYLVEAISAMQLGGVVRLVKRVLIGTAIIEGAGALLLMIRFCPLLGLGEGVWYGVFHSVSAFCNAGFDLMGRFDAFSSLTMFALDPLVCLTIAALILIGGIGFFVWNDIAANRWHFRKYRLHTKLMLVSTLVLLVLSALAFFFFEKDATQAGMTAGERLIVSIFQAVTPRTAGFNTVDLSSLSLGGSALTMLLMFIGAGTGSTGGGVKLTTFAVMLLYTIASARGKSELDVFGRRIPVQAVTKTFSSALVFSAFALVGCFVLVTSQPISLIPALFESLSAIGTVGLSLGVTPTLSPLSRLVVILLMYAGRVGSLSVVMAVSQRKPPKIKLPEEGIII